MRGIILDLCGGTGSWSKPYKDAGYTVQIVDIKTGGDARLWPGRENDVRDYVGIVQGVLAAPPCTVFASSGARWERTDDDLREGLAVADACIRIVHAVRPKWWALENPIGRIVRWLGNPAFRSIRMSMVIRTPSGLSSGVTSKCRRNPPFTPARGR